MKKLIYSLSIFLLFPIISLAADVDYDIEQYYIDAKILENGDVDVSEIFVVDGTFNGYNMNLSYISTKSSVKASDISNIKVYSLDYDEKISFDTFNADFIEFSLVNYASAGESMKYTIDPTSTGYSIKMFYPINREKIILRLDYTIEDIVTLHDGFAEFYWNFFSGELADEISDLNVRVTLPGSDSSDYFRFWAHGPLEGEIDDISNSENNIVYARISSLESYGMLDIRITFADNLVDGITKYSNQSFSEIVDEEMAIAEKTNALRKEIKIKWWGAVIGTIVFYVFVVMAFLYIYFKYDKERDPSFKLKYNREFIDDYNVEVVDYLMNRNITENALSASIMNLIYKKNIKVEKIENVKNGYIFTLLNRDNLNATENALADFLFITVGNNNTFTTTALKKYASNTKTCQTFMNTYTKWKSMVIKDGEKQEFFEKKSKYIVIPFVFLVYSIILTFFIANNNIEFIPGIITVLVAIIFMIYVMTFSKKTKKGIEHFAKWQAFKRFLNDFGNFSVKELPEIILWERYLVYATVFGLADKVEKAMNVKISEIGNVQIDTFTLNYITNIHIANLITSSMHSAINASQVAINQAAASSRMSSGSGFGGGFSGGGGFGGGGRSGGGFNLKKLIRSAKGTFL